MAFALWRELVNAAMAYDVARQKVVLFGGGRGNPGGFSFDTWEWDGSDWTQRFPRNSPPPMEYHKMVYDESRATGCAGTAGVPVLSATTEPWFCEGSFDLSLTNAGSTPVGLLGVSDTTWNGLALPVDFGGIGMPGCQLYVSVEASVPLVATAGTATWSLGFPPLPQLVTRSFYAQCLVFDAGVNALGIVTSNAGKATIGAR